MNSGDGAWIGAGATILSGVTIGKFAIVGAASVVTHDVGDYEVAVGSPAKVIKTLDRKNSCDAGAAGAGLCATYICATKKAFLGGRVFRRTCSMGFRSGE